MIAQEECHVETRGSCLRGPRCCGGRFFNIGGSATWRGGVRAGGFGGGGARMGGANFGGARIGAGNFGGARMGGAYMGGARIGSARVAGATVGGRYGINRAAGIYGQA